MQTPCQTVRGRKTGFFNERYSLPDANFQTRRKKRRTALKTERLSKPEGRRLYFSGCHRPLRALHRTGLELIYTAFFKSLVTLPTPFGKAHETQIVDLAPRVPSVRGAVGQRNRSLFGIRSPVEVPHIEPARHHRKPAHRSASLRLMPTSGTIPLKTVLSRADIDVTIVLKSDQAVAFAEVNVA